MSGCWKAWLGLLFAALLQGLGPDANAASLSIDDRYVIPSAPGPGVGASIGVAFPAFSLTGGDQLQTPVEFGVVVPEPASGLLLGMGLAALARLAPGSGGRTR